MNPAAPSLHLDPLLPLALQPEPHFVPPVAGAVPARAVLVLTDGAYRIGTAHIRAPALVWRAAAEETPVRGSASDGGATAWLLLLGQRLLDQLIVAAFGEPGFSRFLEGFTSNASVPVGEFLEDLQPSLESLERELDDRGPAYRVRARSLLSNVMLSLYRATLTAEATETSNGFRMAAVIDHIELNYGDHLDLESLAEIMETSPTHLSRVFRREVGIPLFEYINRTRIRKACALLRRTELPVTHIAVDVGYNNVSFFNRYFRRIMLCSPREYRRTVTE
jgi:AraC-like DNA-binding protein